MSDVTVNQDATPPDSAASEGKPDVDDLFGKPDVDELFPEGYKAPAAQASNWSPVHDFAFSQANSHARILDAFGHGFAQDWGASELEHQQAYSEADEWMRKSGMWNDYKAGQRSIIKAANEVIMRPAVSALTSLLPLGKALMGGGLHGGEQAVQQTGEEYGFPGLAKEVSAFPQAFPEAPSHMMGIPHVGELPPLIAEAKSLDTIGAGEAGYFGTKPAELATPLESAPAAKAETASQGEAAPGEAAAAPAPSPVAQPVAMSPESAAAAEAPQAAPDIHAVARQIAPQTFQEFDALAQKKDTFRRWISELQEVRDQTAAENAPHADEIADLNSQIEAQQAKKGGYGKLQSLIEKRDALTDERDQYIAEHTQGDTADMAKIRQQLMETDYRMRDLAPDVSKAYRDAAQRMPQAETVEPIATETPVEATQAESAAPAQPALGESSPVGGAEAAPAAPAQAEAVKTTEDQNGIISYTLPKAMDRFGKQGQLAIQQVSEAGTKSQGAFRSDLPENAGGKFVVIRKGENDTSGTLTESGAWIDKPQKPALFDTREQAEAAAKAKLGAAPKPTTAAPEVKPALPIAHAPSIVADVSQKLQAAGRPAEEADAAAQIVAAYWETRAQRFEGRKGTAAEMYAREAPEIVAGKAKAKQASRELELAQRAMLEHNGEKPNATEASYGEALRPQESDVSRTRGVNPEETGRQHADVGPAEGSAPEGEGNIGGGTKRIGEAEGGKDLYQSRVDRGGRSVPVTAVDPHTPLTAVELNDLPQRTRAEAIDEMKRVAGDYQTQSGQQVALRPTTTRKAFSGYVNDIKKSLAGELDKIIEHSVVYGGSGDFDYAVAHLRLDGRDVAVRLVLKKAGDETERLYQFEGFDLENTNPGAEAGTGEQTIAAHFPQGAQPLRGLPAQLRTVGDLVSIFNRHEPGTETLFQEAKGRIRVRDEGRNTITLMKTADASTFIHETGHDWLDRMLKDAKDPDAPEALKADSDTVLKWLGVDSPDAIKTRHHEKFARGFETYMMEGRAPSQGLARVFAKFKTWLTTIYKTVAALKAPISDDIRGVFDRMLAEKPEKTVIAPEVNRTESALAETHEGLAETTAPERAREVANTIQAERDSNVDRNLLDKGENDTRLENAGSGTEGRAARGAQPSGHADEAGAVGGEAGAPVGSGAQRSGGGQTSAEGAQPRKESERVRKAPTPLLNFLASRGGIAANDELIADLKQSLGASNHYVPGSGQLIRTPKQISAAARKAGRFPAMRLDTAREAAVEADLLPEGATIRDMLDAIDAEVRGLGHTREIDEGEQAHAEHNFLEGLNDRIREAGGSELTDKERARALELWHKEGLHDPAQIIERLALEADDDEIGSGAPDRLEGIPGWDVAAPGWESAFDDSRAAPGEGDGLAGAQPGQPGGGAARARSQAEAARRVDPNATLPQAETNLIDKAGNIRLDNLGTPEDVNAVIRATAEELAPFESAITRGRIPDAEVLKLADALGMDAAKLNQRKLGEAFNAEQVMAARKLLIQSATNLRDLAAKAAGGSDADVIAYAEAADRHRMIQEQVSGITAEAGRALRAFRDLAGAQQAKEIAAIVQEGTGRTLYQLRKNAARIANMDTTAQVSKFVHDSERKGLFDWIQSVFINALISGPLTHAGYTAAGEMFALFRAVGETGASALVGKVREIAGLGPEDYAKAAEVPHQLYGMYRGARTGIKASWQAWKANRIILPAEVERQPDLPGITGQSVGSHQTIPNPEIGGITIPIGTVLESPGRLVAALHSFNWTTFYSQSIAGQAFRQAMAEKLEGRAFSDRVAELTQSPTDQMIKAASEDAQGGALMQKPAYGSFTGQISRITNTGIKLPDLPLPGGGTLPLGTLRPLKFIDPFVQIQANVQKTAFGRGTPLALFKQSVRDDLSMKNGGVAFDLAAGKILAGTTFMLAAGGLAAEGLLNNSGPSDPKQARAWQKVYGLPHGLRIGDMSFDALRLGNLGLQMSVAADLYHVAHMVTSEDATNLAGEVVHAFTQNIIDESSMRGPAEILRAVEDHDRYGPAWVRNFASSMLPFSVGLGQIARQIDPYSRNARTLMDAIKAKLPFESETLTPRRDIWGEPVPNRGWLGTYYEHVGKDPVDNALYSLHIYPALPERRIRGVQLSDQQYDDYARISGRTMKMMLNAFVNMPGFAMMPDAYKIQQIDKIVKKARGDARTMVLMQNQSIIQQANDAKRVKRGMAPAATVH